MTNSTPSLPHPNEKTLLFIRTFARCYVPEKNNESEAREMAASICNNGGAVC